MIAVKVISSPGQSSSFSHNTSGAFGFGVTITSTEPAGLTHPFCLQTAVYVFETSGLTMIEGKLDTGLVCHSIVPSHPFAVKVTDSPAQILLDEADNNGAEIVITVTATVFDGSLLQSFDFLQYAV